MQQDPWADYTCSRRMPRVGAGAHWHTTVGPYKRRCYGGYVTGYVLLALVSHQKHPGRDSCDAASARGMLQVTAAGG
jgi:hypothetical protein